MEHDEILNKKYSILSSLNGIPQKMLSLHGTENMTEFVLHELCTPACFNFKNAAYFLDNPDFNCFKGIAGFSAQESCEPHKVWQTPDDFTKHMQQASFNQKVRSITQPSMRVSGKKDGDMVAFLSQQLGLTQPLYCTWNMKHDNHGLLVYEAGADTCEVPQDLLVNGICLLGFCPIY